MGDVVALRPEGNNYSWRLIWRPGDGWIDDASVRFVAITIEDARRIRAERAELMMRRSRAQSLACLSRILSRIYGADSRAGQAARAIQIFLAGIDLEPAKRA